MRKNEASGSTIYKAIEYINQHYTNPLSLNEVMNVAVMSRTTFVNQFKQVTGKSFVEYVHLLRIQLAKQLLQENKHKVTHVGKMCGFESTSYFCRIFLKHTGMTPGTYIAVQKNRIEEDSARYKKYC